jgi:hypothetical protein
MLCYGMTLLSFSFVCIPSKQLFLDVSFQGPLFQSVFLRLSLAAGWKAAIRVPSGRICAPHLHFGLNYLEKDPNLL